MDFFPDEQELEDALHGLRILDNTFSWLVYGAPENEPADDDIARLPASDWLNFLQTAPSSFQDAAFPVIPGVTDQFYTPLETLRGRVQ